MHAILAVSAVLGLGGIAGPQAVDHGAWDRILGRHVSDERVDYLGIRRDAWQELETYLEQLARVDAQDLERPEQLAFLLNLYNATMVHTILRRLRDGYTVAEEEWGVFDEPLVRTQEGRLSLNQLEHEVIRPRFQDPRVHVALVCGARSCPPLLPRAWRAEDLERKLTDAMRRFLEDETRNRRDRETRTLGLSRIFEWYATDFGGKDSLVTYVDGVLDADLAGWRLGPFLEYSWELNGLPPRSGRWVSVREGGATLRGEQDAEGAEPVPAEAGALFEVLGEEGDRLRVRRPFGQGEAWVEGDRTRPWPAPDQEG